MTTLFGITLTKGVAQAVPTLERLAETSLTVTEVLAQARSFGLAFNDSQARAVVPGFRNNLQSDDYFSHIPPSFGAAANRFPVAPNPLRENVEYVVTVFGKDPFTGDATEQTVT